MAPLKALALNCTLKASPAESSCELLLSQILRQLGEHDVEGEIVRVVNLDVKPGVSSDEGFTIPPEGSVYWVGEAMQAVDYKDKSPTPKATATATKTLARNATHLAQLLKAAPYLPPE